MRINAEILAQHLDVAAAQYDRDAAQCRAPLDGAPAKPAHMMLATQFDRQAAQARCWAQALRDGRTLRTGDAVEAID